MRHKVRYTAAALILVGALAACGESSSVEFTRQRNSALCNPDDVSSAEAEVAAATQAQLDASAALDAARQEYGNTFDSFAEGGATQVDVDAAQVKLDEATVLAAIENGGRGTGTMPKEFPINVNDPLHFKVKSFVPPVPESPTNGLDIIS